MPTHTPQKKSLAQLQAERIPLDCCEGAKAVVETYHKPHLLSGTTEEEVVRCNICLRVVAPVTFTVLRP